MQTALLLGLVYVFGWINYNALCSYMHRPIIICALTGLVLGDFKTGLVIGGTMELAWMGLLPYAGNGHRRGNDGCNFWDILCDHNWKLL